MVVYTELSDNELTVLLRRGERLAFNEIYNRHSEYLYRFAFNILKEEEECTDAIQDIFVWLWENREKVQATSLKSYLCAAVKYKLARVIRGSKRRAEILSAHPDVKEEACYTEDALEVKELKSLISQFTGALPPRAKEIFEMSRNEYLSNKEIAVRLGISEKTVENQMTIVLKKLKSNLGKMSFWSVLM
eukprot:gene9291-10895_t